MKTFCSIPFNEQLWGDISSEVDCSGQIVLEDNAACIQVMPIEEFGFMVDVEPVIEIVVTLSSQVAVGLFINWLSDKLKQRKTRKIVINKKEYEVENKEALEKAILDEIKQNE